MFKISCAHTHTNIKVTFDIKKLDNLVVTGKFKEKKRNRGRPREGKKMSQVADQVEWEGKKII